MPGAWYAPDANDLFENQWSDDGHLPLVLIQRQKKWAVERILDERRRGRGRQYLVKWAKFDRPTWESVTALADTSALDVYENQKGGGGVM